MWGHRRTAHPHGYFSPSAGYLGGTLRFLHGRRRTRHPLLRRAALAGAAPLIAASVMPEAAAQDRGSGPSGTSGPSAPSSGGLSAVIRYTENGIPHILARDYAHLGFGTGWAQAADQVCVLADGFLTVAGERSRWFGPDAAPDGSLSSAAKNLSSDLYFKDVRDSGAVEKLLATPAPAGPGKDVKELMRGWAAGHNAWLAQNKITDTACKGARWVRPVTVTDVAARGFAVSVLGGQGRAVDGITAARPPGPTAPGAARSRGASRRTRGPLRRAGGTSSQCGGCTRPRAPGARSAGGRAGGPAMTRHLARTHEQIADCIAVLGQEGNQQHTPHTALGKIHHDHGHVNGLATEQRHRAHRIRA